MDYIRINPADNVAVALADLKAGTLVEGVTLKTDVPQGHKITLKPLAEGENVIKYGFPIGHVVKAVEAGEWIDHNSVKTNLEGLLDYSYTPAKVEIAPAEVHRTFRGFRRGDGSVGIRNQIWVIPTVGCVNGVCQEIVRRFNDSLNQLTNQSLSGAEGPVDAVVAFPHNYGCSQLGEDH